MPFNSLQGTLQRPLSGIGRRRFPVEIDLDSLVGPGANALDELDAILTGRALPIFFRGPAGGGGGGGGGSPLRQPAGGARAPSTRFSAYSPGSSFYGGAGAGFGSLALGGTRIGLGGGLALGGGIFAAGALAELSRNLIDASASFETFRRTVEATEATSADAEERWQRLLDIANATVGTDIQGLVAWNSQLRVVGVESERVDAILRSVVRSVSELGRGVEVSREALAQLTDGVVRNHLTVRDWRAIVARVPQFLSASSRALGQTVLSLDDFRDAADASGVSISEGILRSLEELDRTAVGLEGTYVAALDRVNEATLKLQATLGEPLKDAVTPALFGVANTLNAINDALNDLERLSTRERIVQLLRGLRGFQLGGPLGGVAGFFSNIPEADRRGSNLAGELRAFEADQRRQALARQGLLTTPGSLDFFAGLSENPILQEEFLRQDLSRQGGDFVQQLAATEANIQRITRELREAIPSDSGQQTVAQQRVVEGLQRELELQFVRVRVLRELNQERERELRLLSDADNRAQILRNRFITGLEGFPGIEGSGERTRTREVRRRREAGVALQAFIRQNLGYPGIQGAPFLPGQDEGAAAVRRRRFIEANRGYAGILTDSDEARVPSLRDLEERRVRRFRELGRGRGGDRDIQRLVAEALRSGPESIDYIDLYNQYEDYQRRKAEAEREEVRRVRRTAREYQRIWENTFDSIADTAVSAIFDRNLNFADALSSLAQNTLQDLTSFYLRQFFGGGDVGGLLGSGTAAGAGVALGVSGALFGTEFGNLFEEISNTVSRIPRLFHSPANDLYAQATGADLARAFESAQPDSRQNATDLANNLRQGFRREIANTQQTGLPSGDLNITINLGENDDAKIQFAVRLKELIAQGQVQFP